jgi:micrococcal nuclease
MAIARMRFMFISVLLVSVFALAACEFEIVAEKATDVPAPNTSSAPVGETATVTRVIDGDTIDVRISGETFRVRYIGINTPEREEPCYAESTQANANWVQGRTVTLVQDVSNTDQYGRLLRYIYVGDVFVNAELIAAGYAESVYYPPDTTYATYFNTLEENARRASLGCHPTGVFR